MREPFVPELKLAPFIVTTSIIIIQLFIPIPRWLALFLLTVAATLYTVASIIERKNDKNSPIVCT